MTEAQRRASEKYDKANTVGLHLKLNRNTDADIIAHLDTVENKQGYVKSLIREKIIKTNTNTIDNDRE